MVDRYFMPTRSRLLRTYADEHRSVELRWVGSSLVVSVDMHSAWDCSFELLVYCWLPQCNLSRPTTTTTEWYNAWIKGLIARTVRMKYTRNGLKDSAHHLVTSPTWSDVVIPLATWHPCDAQNLHWWDAWDVRHTVQELSYREHFRLQNIVICPVTLFHAIHGLS